MARAAPTYNEVPTSSCIGNVEGRNPDLHPQCARPDCGPPWRGQIPPWRGGTEAASRKRDRPYMYMYAYAYMFSVHVESHCTVHTTKLTHVLGSLFDLTKSG